MSVVGMFSSGAGQSDERVGGDADQTTGLSDAAAFGQVLEDGEGGRFGKSAAIQGRTLAFGEASTAGVAVEKPELLVFAVVAADREIASGTLAVEQAVRILATETGEIVHEVSGPGELGGQATRRRERKTSHILRRIPFQGSIHLRHHRIRRITDSPSATLRSEQR
jgi:hypothetical protein